MWPLQGIFTIHLNIKETKDQANIQQAVSIDQLCKWLGGAVAHYDHAPALIPPPQGHDSLSMYSRARVKANLTQKGCSPQSWKWLWPLGINIVQGLACLSVLRTWQPSMQPIKQGIHWHDPSTWKPSITPLAASCNILMAVGTAFSGAFSSKMLLILC